MTPTSVLTHRTWWVDLGQRLLRQGLQVAAPVLAAVLATSQAGTNVDVPAVAAGLGAALAVTLAKAALLALAGVTVTAGSPTWQQVLDRVVPAAAGALAALVPIDAAGALALPWQAVATTAVTAGLLAALGLSLDQPNDVKPWVSPHTMGP